MGGQVIPVDGEAVINGDRQKRLLEVIPEILIAKELCHLRKWIDEPTGDLWSTANFIPVISVSVVMGSFPLPHVLCCSRWN